jgi:hypothetical protein
MCNSALLFPLPSNVIEPGNEDGVTMFPASQEGRPIWLGYCSDPDFLICEQFVTSIAGDLGTQCACDSPTSRIRASTDEHRWAASSTNAEHPYGRERNWNRRPPEPNSPRLFSSFLARLTPAVFRYLSE